MLVTRVISAKTAEPTEVQFGGDLRRHQTHAGYIAIITVATCYYLSCETCLPRGLYVPLMFLLYF